MALGGRFTLETELTNTGTASTGRLLAHLNIASIQGSVYVDPEDWANRKHWNAYQNAAREMIARTDMTHAPWTVVPADDKRFARLQVLRALGDRIEAALD